MSLKLSKARKLSKAQNMGAKAAQLVRESHDMSLMSVSMAGRYFNELPLGPTFASTAQNRAAQAAAYARTAASYVFAVYPELRD